MTRLRSGLERKAAPSKPPDPSIQPDGPPTRIEAGEGITRPIQADATPSELLERVRRREPAALAAFFDRYFGRVFGVAFRLTGEHHLAEDVTQEVFFKAYRAAHRLDPSRDPGSFLVTIAINTCRDMWRSGQHRMARRTVPLDGNSARRVSSPVRAPDRELIAREREQQVQEAIAQLPDNLRVAVVLHDYDRLPHDEIAAIVGVSGMAIRKRYSRALRMLATRLSHLLEP